ncbi:hypothetical protein NDU88_010375 [Pleurodeles waltl]|uniref:Ig-like domain-containing protein n=1 Tax=Pleurodeles waltl TaxID=8319 RepID=A0AAV7PVH9_PLEWA|nr:hypothetical protein NDU88_010375 [Pleurodeles waltl]
MLQVSKGGLAFILVQSAAIFISGQDIEGITSPCTANRPCGIALASHNQITLRCHNIPEKANVSWQYLNIFEPHGEPVTFVTSSGPVIGLKQAHLLNVKTQLNYRHLTLRNPSVESSGVYTCKVGDNTLAYYEIDFQDAEQMYVSYADLGEMVQKETLSDLGNLGKVLMFTVWGEWQPCDRCGRRGERKRVGFCYFEVTKGNMMTKNPTPCGFLQLQYPDIEVMHRVEVRIEGCEVSCAELSPLKANTASGRFVLLDIYHTRLHANIILTCPTSSIYR